ncbi:MAG TPA: hypothetical protein VK400_09075 [Pyrinomonadaceae bacterium]|nr:hypothetical protein [Pyrinomonadaceae bacterium]
MKNKYLLNFLIVFCFLPGAAFAQTTIVVSDPTKNEKSPTASAAEENLIKRNALPQARKLWAEDETCTEEFEIAGAAKGAFTRAGAKQTLIFYQFCQIGNGFGHNGLVLMENGKIAAHYTSAGGWAIGLKSLPDINQNGLDEFTVFYSGGMHQGQGGTGVDVMEFSSAGTVKGLGWFQADMYGEETGDYGYKVTVKPGKAPVFYREKYISLSDNKWRKSGRIAAFRLGKPYGKFEVLK